MKKHIVLASLLSLVALSGFAASPPVSDSINVTATNGGVFTFDITQASYAFGTIDAAGTAPSGIVSSPAPVGGTIAGGARYLAAGASTWTCTSAPPRTVRIFNASAAPGPGTITWGAANGSQLEMQIPTTGLSSGTTCNFLAYNVTGDGVAACASGNLIHSMTVGMGALAKTGNLDLRLTVNNIDATGLNTWTVVLTANGI